MNLTAKRTVLESVLLWFILLYSAQEMWCQIWTHNLKCFIKHKLARGRLIMDMALVRGKHCMHWLAFSVVCLSSVYRPDSLWQMICPHWLFYTRSGLQSEWPERVYLVSVLLDTQICLQSWKGHIFQQDLRLKTFCVQFETLRQILWHTANISG